MECNKYRLSVIIPAYNAGQYLERCVYSCEHQNIPDKEYEVIIVNDGSKDNTFEVANKLADRYCNVRVLSKENGGASSARNMGLDHAEGEYVTFVDSDDYLLSGKLESILSTAEKNRLDLCFFNMKLLNSNGTFIEVTPNPLVFGEIYNCEEAFFQGVQPGSVCSKIYSKKMLDKSKIRFRSDLIFGEDSYFSFQVLFKSERIMNTNIFAYIYRNNPQSVTRRQNECRKKEKRKCEDSLHLIKLVGTYSDEKEISARFRTFLKDYTSSLSFGFLKSMMDSSFLTYQDSRELIAKAKSLFVYPCIATSHNLPKTMAMHFLNTEFILKLILRHRLKSR